MKFENICKKIENKEYQLKSPKYVWAGAGAAISKDFMEMYDNDNTVVYYCTENAAEYIWLLEEMKAVVDVDYLSKYAFYPMFVEAVKTIDASNENIQAKLLKVLEKMEEEQWAE